MNIEMLRKTGWIIFETVTGSRAYGTAIDTPQYSSDEDVAGIFILPLDHRVTIKQPLFEVGQTKPDIKYYELAKFMSLAKEVNPNIVEYFFMPQDCIRICDPRMQKLIDNRKLFISKKALYTFSGYSFAQCRKAKGENKWINNKKSEEPPKREDFCWFIKLDHKERGGAFVDTSYGKPEFVWPKAPYRPVPIKDIGLDLSTFAVAGLEHVPDTYRLYYYHDGSKGVFRNGNLVCESIPLNEEMDRCVGLLIYNDQEYQKAMQDWKNYHTWFRERNPERWLSQERGEVDYDCYLDSETEFLTDHGWKKFDEVSKEDKLASVIGDNTLVFERPNCRIDRMYSGELWTHENRYTRFSVTPNHKLLLSFCHRGPKTGFSVKYEKAHSDWRLISVCDYMKGRKSHAHVVAGLKNEKIDYPISDDMIRLIGAYVSKGSIAFNKKGSAQAVYFAQNGGKPLCFELESVTSYEIRKTTHTGRGKEEITYRIQDKCLAKKFYREMGHGCKNKKLPEYAFSFSVRQTELLLKIMMMGDGTRSKKGHGVYYSSSLRLVSDLQLLLFLSGRATQLYGPYDYGFHDYGLLGWFKSAPMYQLFISTHPISVVTINKQEPRTLKSQFGWRKKLVENKRVVCFDMPSGVVITRNNHKIAVQGNCKNLMHCVRLLLSGEAILKTGEPIVRFEGEQLQYLKDIRAGKFTYEQIMADVEKRMEDLKAICDASTLPWGPDIDAIDNLYRDLVMS